MRYLGGKTRIAKAIAEIVNAERGDRVFWEPFCGGLSVSVRLAAHGPGIVSDAHPSLIALYQAVRDGWAPPKHVAEEEYQAARSLPDHDPLKGFIGFGCSFGGKWFGGMARGGGRNYAAESARAIVRDVRSLGGCAIRCKSFFDWTPRARPFVIYCDPPYAGTTGYGATGEFDHARFWAQAQAWERCGVPVFVSEYSCPVPHRVVWSKEKTVHVAGGSEDRNKNLERLFRVEV